MYPCLLFRLFYDCTYMKTHILKQVETANLTTVCLKEKNYPQNVKLKNTDLVQQACRAQFFSSWCLVGWRHTHTHQSAAGKHLRSSGSLFLEPGCPPPRWSGRLMGRKQQHARFI